MSPSATTESAVILPGIRDELTAFSAFYLSFFGETLAGRPGYWSHGLENIWEAMGYVANEITPNAFRVLERCLRRLGKMKQTLFRSPKAYAALISLSDSRFAGEPRPKRKPGPLTDKILKWCELAAQFCQVIHLAIPETSPYRVWVDCGRAVGRCACRPEGERWSSTDEQKGALTYIQDTVRQLPPEFVATYAWLRNFCEFDFGLGGPQEWAAQMPRDEQGKDFYLDDLAKVTNCNSFTDFFQAKMTFSIIHIPERCPKVLGNVEVKVVSPAINRDAGPRWDEKNREFLIDGVVVHTYKRKAVNQFCVLRAFEAAGWEHSIESPLRKDLHSQTLKALNAHAPDKIEFHGDGTGEGLRWEKPGEKQPNGRNA